MQIQKNFQQVQQQIPESVTLVAVSKTHPVEAIQMVYDMGHRVFGENKVQELLQKKPLLPPDIKWHLIGHLQTNKVRQIIPHIHLIHSVDRPKLLHVIHKEAERIQLKVNILLQIHIAQEDTKQGWNAQELTHFITQQTPSQFPWINFCGLMGMATFTDNTTQVKAEFQKLHTLFHQLKPHMPPSFVHLSMGMSGDFPLAIQQGSTMVRIGSTIFGTRNYSHP